MRRFLAILITLVCILPLGAQEQSVRPGINKPFEDPDLKKYLGVFEGESREIFALRKEIVAACKVKAGQVVADIGAGTGLFTRLFAAEVGDQGRVYGVDIAERFLKHIEKTCQEAGINNVVTRRCTATSCELPPNSLDVAFICDTYHHFEFPFRTLDSIHQALRPGGRMIVIDFRRIPGVSREWVLGHVRAGQEVVTKEITTAGFKRVAEEKLPLKENYFLVFEKVDPKQVPPLAGKVQSFVYKSTKQADLQMDVHFPPDWKKGDRRPGIVFFFGGGWNQGKVTQFLPQAKYLASRGLVAARADYRVKSRHGVSPVQCVEDAKSAVRWLRHNAVWLGIDPDRIVAAGGSAGGHIAACTAIPEGIEPAGEDTSLSSRPNALVLFNPVLKFEGVPTLLQRLDDAKPAKHLSPTLYVSKDTPPAILFYGKTDRLLEHGREFIARSKEKGHRAEMFLADGVGHGFFNKPPWRERTLLRADEFLQSLGYLKGPATIKEQ